MAGDTMSWVDIPDSNARRRCETDPNNNLASVNGNAERRCIHNLIDRLQLTSVGAKEQKHSTILLGDRFRIDRQGLVDGKKYANIAVQRNAERLRGKSIVAQMYMQIDVVFDVGDVRETITKSLEERRRYYLAEKEPANGAGGSGNSGDTSKPEKGKTPIRTKQKRGRKRDDESPKKRKF